MTKSLKSWWDRFLFRDSGIVPSKRMIIIYLVFSAGLVGLAFSGIGWAYLALANGLFLLISLLDLFFSPKKSEVAFTRMMPEEMERGLEYEVMLGIANASRRPAHFYIRDGLPQSFQAAFPLSGRVNGFGKASLAYQTTAPVRGKYKLEKLYIRYGSLLGLWEKQTTAHLEDTVKVIPDLTDTRQYLESAQQFLLYEGMEIRKRERGIGEFSQIRNYVVGDDSRKINWRQTAKLQEVMTNEYEPEHGKYISILIDCGRMMGAELETGNRLEKVLEAAMTVAAAALKNGDYVSVLAFSKDIKAFVPPGNGMNHLQTILHSIYNLEVEAAESNYSAVLHYLQSVQKKRSMILLFSDVQTFLHEESALVYLQRLRRQHVFLMIGIEDETITERINEAPATVRKAMVKTIAQQQMLTKKREKAKWEKQGMVMVEASEDRLAAAAVSHYIDIMNRGLL